MDVFEDKESTETGSLAETESPPLSSGGGGGVVLPEVMNITAAVGPTSTAASAGGGVVVSGVMNSGGGDLMNNSVKKKRGRPRKYDSDGNLSVSYIKSVTAPGGGGGGAASPAGFTLTSSPNSSGFSSSTPKRGRGRPAGSGNWQFLASLGKIFASTAGGDFTPHVVTVYAGEDVAGKILSFVEKGSRGMCVLSANGSVSNVTIRQPGSSGGILTYEGRFEILSLTGSFTTSENGGIKSRTGGLSVSLAGPDGRVIGGGVAGLLTAASPIQIVVGSFMPNSYGQKLQKRKYNTEPKTAPVILGSPDPVSVVARPSQAAAAPESIVSPKLPLPSQGEAGHSFSSKDTPNSTATNTAHWNGSAPTLGQRPSPDINLSIEQH